jgi:hypothetical protein
MKISTSDPSKPRVTFVEASMRQYTGGTAIGKRVKIKLEDHPIKNPITGRLTDYLVDLDLEGKGWYLVSLDSLERVYLDPVREVLVNARGGVDYPTVDRPSYDKEGRRISYYYNNPFEEMLLNPLSRIKYVIAKVATVKDPIILRDKRLVHNQIQIFPYATIWREQATE